ncbi:MAG: tRNA 2-thiouridine(34) synthase MnmA [Caulobacteraceae bacterium]
MTHRLINEALRHAARPIEGLAKGARVVAAMSGGVDSTVAAALLKASGHEVVGITLQLYDHGVAAPRGGACCAGRDILDARAAATSLGIAHYVLDYESRFRDEVMEDFAESYVRGETPVPCVRCNQTVKFRDLLEIALDLGAQALVTGHYVRRIEKAGHVQLHRARDTARDQSYFLFATTARQLDILRFPLGGLDKPTVRRLAGEFGLAVADKADSQDICFVPHGRYTTVIDRLRPRAAACGEIVHLDGRVLGRHKGVAHYTVGQRRGLNVAVGEPLFVIRLDSARNVVVVGPRRALEVGWLELREANWLGDHSSLEAAAAENLAVLARVRSTRAPAPARLRLADGEAAVVFQRPEEGVAPGQACVLYDPAEPERVLGGGFIARTDRCPGAR